MPAARAEPSCITAHPAHDPLATPRRNLLMVDSDVAVFKQMSRWVMAMWTVLWCGFGTAAVLHHHRPHMGIILDHISPLHSVQCTPYTWLFNAPTRHTATHLTQFENFIHCESVKHLDSSAPPHLARELSCLCFKNQTNKVVIYKHLLQAKMAPVCFVKIVLNWETIWPFDPGLTIRASDKANNIGG